MEQQRQPPNPASDDTARAGRLHTTHLNLGDEQEVIATAEAFGVTPQELRAAAVTTGTDLAALQAHFESQ